MRHVFVIAGVVLIPGQAMAAAGDVAVKRGEQVAINSGRHDCHTKAQAPDTVAPGEEAKTLFYSLVPLTMAKG